MFEKRKEEEELPGCLNERRFDNILFSRKRKKDSEYLGYERIITHTTLSHLMRVPLLLSCVWRMLRMPYNEQRSNNQVSFRIWNIRYFYLSWLSKQQTLQFRPIGEFCYDVSLASLWSNWHSVYSNECGIKEIAMIDEVSYRQKTFYQPYKNKILLPGWTI